MTTQSINLNVIPGGVLPRINVSQYDKGLEQIVATLYEGSAEYTMPSSATVYVQGTKKDGTGFQYTCSYSNNVVTIDLTEQMTVFAGEVVTELVIFDSSNNRIATCNFIIYVESTALPDDTVVSETDLPVLQQIPEYAEIAHQWATYGDDTDTPSSTNNSKYWAEQSQIYAQGALHWKGSIAFASIPTSNLTVGDLYNITNDFTTDSRFIEGSGKKCAAGTNIVWSDSSKWDILTSATYASQVKYSNTSSGLTATNTQDAIDELNTDLTELTTLIDKTNDCQFTNVSTARYRCHIIPVTSSLGLCVLKATLVTNATAISYTIPKAVYDTFINAVMTGFDNASNMAIEVGTYGQADEMFTSTRTGLINGGLYIIDTCYLVSI